MTARLPNIAGVGDHTLSGTVLLVDAAGNPLIVSGRSLTNAKPVDVAIVDSNGNQISTFGGSGGTASNFGATFPTSGTAAGASDGTNMQPLLVDGSGNLKVNVAAGGAAGQQYADGAARGTATGTLAMGDDGTNIQSVSVDTSGKLNVNVSNTPTVTANAGTNLNTSALALDATLTGGNQVAIVKGGAKGSTAAAVVTSNPVDANTQALHVDGSKVTQPISGSVSVSNFPATQPVSGTVTANQGTANATPWNENLAQVGGTNVVTSVAGAPGVGGDTADGAADAGKSVKIGGKVVLNSAALPTALTASQRAPLMTDEYGRPRIIINRPKILGSYKFESGRLTVQATAHAATAGFFWLINPVGSTVLVYVKKLFFTSVPTAVTAFASSPRITVERVTFTGTASGATITPCKRDSTDAANTATVRTASTGLTLTAGAIAADWVVPAVLTAVGIAVPVDQWFYDASDEDDLIILRAGEGIVVRQPDAGTTSDTRVAVVFGSWEER